MKTGFTTFLILIITFHASAQTSSCDCAANLDTLILKTEINYAGFPVKTSKRNKTPYNTLVKQLRNNAQRISDPVSCYDILKTYVLFFKDRHFDIAYTLDSSQKRFSILREPDFKQASSKNSIEGIWANPDTSIKIGMRQTGIGQYEGVVIESKHAAVPVGLVYVMLRQTPEGFIYAKHDFLTANYPARQHGGLLRLWNVELWGKVYPEAMTTAEQTELESWKEYNSGMAFQQLDEKTAYLRIPSFNRDDRVAKIIQDNDAAIRRSQHLIVDLRGNGGGNTGWSYLLPYFMTQPIHQGYTYVRLSPENKQRLLNGLKPIVTQPVSPEMAKYYTPAVMQQFKKAYDEIPGSKSAYYPVPSITIPLDSVSAYPQKIALIFDDLCGSSTEYFFHLSKQSKKITRYGIHTLGMMDYAGMPEKTLLPFKGFSVVMPDTRSSWTEKSPIDATGMKPEKDLGKIPYQDWVEFVRKDL